MYEVEESALLERCRDGDRQALQDLYRRYEKPVFNVALRITGSRADAADVTQTVFMKAFENLQKFDPRHRFFSWIYRIAVNESIRSTGYVNRRQPLSDTEQSPDRGPESRAESERLSDLVQSSLMELGGKYRAVLVLKHFLDFSYREISAILQLPEPVVKSRLYTARQTMKQSLQARKVV